MIRTFHSHVLFILFGYILAVCAGAIGGFGHWLTAVMIAGPGESGARWLHCFRGYLASVLAMTAAVFLFVLLAISAETGVFESGLIGPNGFKIFGLEFMAVAAAVFPVWPVIAWISERNARRKPWWHARSGALAAALMMAAIAIEAYDSDYYAQTGHWVAAVGVFLFAVCTGALGGFVYWLTAARRAAA